MRVPQNGGTGTSTSAATSERAGTSTGSSLALRSAAMRFERARRALRSASFSRGAIGTGRHLDRLLLSFAFPRNAFRPGPARLALGLLLAGRDRLRTVRIRAAAALLAHDAVHQPQTLERIAGVVHLALVDLGQIV